MEVKSLQKRYKRASVYRKKFVPNIKTNKDKLRKHEADHRKKYYTEDWDTIRKKVYRRDGYKCVLCGKKGKLHAHHIIPVRISRDNSLSNLVSVCNKCHRKLEEVGFSILENGGSRTDVKRAEMKMIAESMEKRKNENV